MKLERLISVFDKSTEKLVKEVNIDNFLDLTMLKSIFILRVDDPEMYDPYEINEEAMTIINQYITPKIEFDRSKYVYQMDCFKAD